MGGIIEGVSGIASALAEITRPRREYKWNKRAASDANRMNRENAEWMLAQEKLLRDESRGYDSPASQMKRYLEAGLNPHLIYGSGGSAGQAFASHAPSLPGVNIQAPSVGNPIAAFLAAGQAAAGMQLTQAKTDESYTKQALMDAQADVVRTNPMLKTEVLDAVVRSMIATADAKAKEAKAMWRIREQTTPDGWRRYTIGEEKIKAELANLEQRFDLNSLDVTIKNKIIESKEFENAIKEVQSRFLKDAEVTPEHIRQFLMLIMAKFLGAAGSK